MSETINHNIVYNRIKEGKPYGKNLKPYPKKVLLKVLEMLANDDEFEKCIEIEKFMEKRYNHESNYLISKYIHNSSSSFL